MAIELIAKIAPKNDGFTGMVDADQVIGGGASGTLPDACLAETNLTQFGIYASIRYVSLVRAGVLTEYPDPDDAFTAATMSGDLILVPAGTFYCSGGAYLTAENQSIVGLAGPDDCVLQFDADVGSIALYLYNATSASNIRVNYNANSSSARYAIAAGSGTVLKNVLAYCTNAASGNTYGIRAETCTLYGCWGDATTAGAGNAYGLNFNDSTAYYSHGRARGGAGDNQAIRFDSDNDSWLYFCTGVGEGASGTRTGLELWSGTGYAFMCRFDGDEWDVSVASGETMYVADCKYDTDNSRAIGSANLISMDGDRWSKSSVKSVADGCVVSDAGGTDVDWTAGHIFYNSQTYSINSAASQALTNNAVNYIYFDHGVDVNELQISTTRPTDSDQVWVACAACQDGDIVGLCNVDTLEGTIPDLSLALGMMFPTFVIEGGLVSAYSDPTSDLDVIMTAMTYVAGAHELRTAAEINSEDNAMKTHFHDAANAWDSSTSNTVDTSNYDDPTDGVGLIAIPASKWVRGMFYYSQELLNYIYPITYYNTEAQALAAENPATPPGLERCIPLAAIVFQQGETDIADATYIDIRPGNVHTGATPTSDHGNLAGLSDDDHPQYLPVDGSRALTDYLDIDVAAIPAAPIANVLRLYVEDIQGFPFFSFVDDTGMVRKIVRDSVFVAKNETLAIIPANRAVYATGSAAGVPTVDKARANNVATMPSIGVTLEAIPIGGFGRVMQVGLIENVNTAAFAAGDVLYVSSTVAGVLVATPPLWPNIRQEIGTVLVSDAAVGAVQVVARSMFNEGILDHGGLLGLDDDDHSQYLLEDGTRAMSGNLDMGGNEITNVGNVDGVDVSDHSARHDVGGADALTTTDGQVASEILATDANKGVRPTRLGVGVAVPSTDGQISTADDINIATGKEIYPEGELGQGGLMQRLYNRFGLATYDWHRTTDPVTGGTLTWTTTPATLYNAHNAGYTGVYRNTYWCAYPGHATLPSFATTHTADPIASSAKMGARVLATASCEFGLWADNYDSDRAYVNGDRIYAFSVYCQGVGALTDIKTRYSYTTMAGGVWPAWTHVAVNTYAGAWIAAEGICLQLIVNYGGTSICYGYVVGEHGSVSGVGNAPLYDDAASTQYNARRMGVFCRTQGFAYSCIDWIRTWDT